MSNNTKILIVGNDTVARSAYLKTYSGQEMLKKHSLQEIGIWNVYGEDPNCDMGGPHHTPLLGTYKGKLEDVVDLAVTLPRFYQWGGGGRIEPVIPPNVIEVSRA